MKILGKAVGSFFGAIGMALVTAIVGGGAALFVAYQNAGGHWPPSILTDVTVGVIALMAGYAGAVTIILRAIADVVVGATKTVSKEANETVKAS